jgi:hypothetical protein
LTAGHEVEHLPQGARGEEGEVEEWIRHGRAGRIDEEDWEQEGFHRGWERKRSNIEGARWDNGSRGRTTATRGGVRLGRKRRRRKRAMMTKRTTTKRTTTKRRRRRLNWQRKRRRRRKTTTI